MSEIKGNAGQHMDNPGQRDVSEPFPWKCITPQIQAVFSLTIQGSWGGSYNKEGFVMNTSDNGNGTSTISCDFSGATPGTQVNDVKFTSGDEEYGATMICHAS